MMAKQLSLFPRRKPLTKAAKEGLISTDITVGLELALSLGWSRIEVFKWVATHQIKNSPPPFGCSNIIYFEVYENKIHLALYYQRELFLSIKDSNFKYLETFELEFPFPEIPECWNTASKAVVRKWVHKTAEKNNIAFSNAMTRRKSAQDAV